MIDIFISYSRKDKEFVTEFYEALCQQQWDIWADWENRLLINQRLDEDFSMAGTGV
ncbi:MAG: toll/interleukin-1 receptor domain-containing protein [Symplocastrum torsivum CPER-KK1]|uniref:Toll/interleukin-1 receptor domain-containing protein n=1 Tax=Symplocastrum torsivum CPER-KK1 TaxID=450513 RepID=A0A951PSJ9_9CYAN|nr:toll/interleukin-1 receptor domain-containing protein [Symplocastrum torsivum CPER-KK1]